MKATWRAACYAWVSKDQRREDGGEDGNGEGGGEGCELRVLWQGLHHAGRPELTQQGSTRTSTSVLAVVAGLSNLDF
jgi:hypothetical protein